MLFASEAQLTLIPYNFPLLHFIPETLKCVKRWLPLAFYLKSFYHIARTLQDGRVKCLQPGKEMLRENVIHIITSTMKP